MKKLIVLTVSLLTTATACPPQPAPPDPNEPQQLGACPSACFKLRSWKCPEGFPTKNGLTCEDFCVQGVKSPVAALNPMCVQQAATIANMQDICNVRCIQ